MSVCGVLQGSVLGARSRREAEFLEVGDSVEVNEGSRHHQDVEELVGVELEEAERRRLTGREGGGGGGGGALTHPDVTLPWEEPLGDAGGVQTGSGDVEGGHEQQPAHLAHGGGLDHTLADDEVEGGNHAAQAQTHEHA